MSHAHVLIMYSMCINLTCTYVYLLMWLLDIFPKLINYWACVSDFLNSDIFCICVSNKSYIPALVPYSGDIIVLPLTSVQYIYCTSSIIIIAMVPSYIMMYLCW